MSIICLNSKGQSPQNFVNHFPQQIQLGPGAEISVIGYSGRLKGENSTEGVEQIVIERGVNDTLIVYHGKTDIASDDRQRYYQPFPVILEEGTYTASAFATEIALSCNYFEYVDTYAETGWTCTFDAGTDLLTLKCGQRRAPVNEAGNWSVYSGQSGGITPAAASTTLNPFQANNNRTSFFDLRTGFIGDTTQAVASTAAGSNGCVCEFTTADTDYTKCQFSFGLVPEERATKCERNPADMIEDTPLGVKFGNSRASNMIYSDNQVINTAQDFAVGGSGKEVYGYFTFGMCVGVDGLVGIIESDVGNSQGVKPGRVINWSATNLGAAGVKKLAICPRYDTDHMVLEFLADVGAGYVSLGTKRIDAAQSFRDIYIQACKIHYGVVYDPAHIDDGATPPVQHALNVKMSGIYTRTATGPGAEPDENVLIGWLPPGQNNSGETELKVASGYWDMRNQANGLGHTMGNITDESDSATAFSVGFVSQDKLNEIINDFEYSPMMITCPDLSVRGYVGAGPGGGTESQIIGIMRTAGNDKDFAFSSECADNWIKLHNTTNISLTRLQIILKTCENNIEVDFLNPNTTIWIKFKCDAPKCGHKEKLTTGGFSNINRYERMNIMY